VRCASAASGTKILSAPTPRSAEPVTGDRSDNSEGRSSHTRGKRPDVNHRSASTAATQAATTDATLSTGLVARLAERDRQRRFRRWRRIGIAAASTVVAAGAVYLVGFSPAFAVHAEQIQITGQTEVVAVEQVSDLVRKTVGRSIVLADTGSLREEIRQVEGVKDAKVHRDWPGGLQVEILPRKPVAVLAIAGDPVLVDGEGVQLNADVDIEGLPRISAEKDDAAAIKSVLDILTALPADVRSQVVSFEALSRDDIRSKLASDQTIRWGDASDVTLKLAVARALQEVAPEAILFDVSSPDLPVTR